MEHKVPARIPARSFYFIDGQIEAEEEEIIVEDRGDVEEDADDGEKRYISSIPS